MGIERKANLDSRFFSLLAAFALKYSDRIGVWSLERKGFADMEDKTSSLQDLES